MKKKKIFESKEKWQGLAGIPALNELDSNNPNEGMPDRTPIEVTLKTTIGELKQMALPNWNINIDDQFAKQEFEKEMEEDLNNWFQNNGDTWIADGINQDVYTNFTSYKD